jgi:hypothetical protein
LVLGFISFFYLSVLYFEVRDFLSWTCSLFTMVALVAPDLVVNSIYMSSARFVLPDVYSKVTIWALLRWYAHVGYLAMFYKCSLIVG